MLASLVHLSGTTATQLEIRLGYGAGTVHRLFRGVIELKLRHILVILESLDIPPAQFFREAFPEEEKTPQEPAAAARILELLERSVARRSPAISDKDLERRLRAALARIGFEPPPSGG
jgi:transcriptional regulator with XRE-family HTH domain